jgi:hypothetical protein
MISTSATLQNVSFLKEDVMKWLNQSQNEGENTNVGNGTKTAGLHCRNFFKLIKLFFIDNELFDCFSSICMSSTSDFIRVMVAFFGNAYHDRISVLPLEVAKLIVSKKPISDIFSNTFLSRLNQFISYQNVDAFNIIPRLSETLFLTMARKPKRKDRSLLIKKKSSPLSLPDFYGEAECVKFFIHPCAEAKNVVENVLKQKRKKKNDLEEALKLVFECIDSWRTKVAYIPGDRNEDDEEEHNLFLDITLNATQKPIRFYYHKTDLCKAVRVFVAYVDGEKHTKILKSGKDKSQFLQRWFHFVNNEMTPQRAQFLKEYLRFGKPKFTFSSAEQEEFLKNPADFLVRACLYACNVNGNNLYYKTLFHEMFTLIREKCLPPEWLEVHRDPRYRFASSNHKVVKHIWLSPHYIDKELDEFCKFICNCQIWRPFSTETLKEVGTFKNVYRMMLNAQQVKNRAFDKRKEIEMEENAKEPKTKKLKQTIPTVKITARPVHRDNDNENQPLTPLTLDLNLNGELISVIMPGFSLVFEHDHVIVYRKIVMEPESKSWDDIFAGIIDKNGDFYPFADLRNYDGPQSVDQITPFNWKPGYGPLLVLLRVLESEPMKSSSLIAKLTGSCLACGLPMTDEESLKAGFGKKCLKHLGLVGKRAADWGNAYEVNNDNEVIANAPNKI